MKLVQRKALETKDFPPFLYHLPIGSNSDPLESVLAQQSPDTDLPAKYLGESSFSVENCSVYHEEEQRNVCTKRAEKVIHTSFYIHAHRRAR